jgi:hypothetical protein
MSGLTTPSLQSNRYQAENSQGSEFVIQPLEHEVLLSSTYRLLD